MLVSPLICLLSLFQKRLALQLQNSAFTLPPASLSPFPVCPASAGPGLRSCPHVARTAIFVTMSWGEGKWKRSAFKMPGNAEFNFLSSLPPKSPISRPSQACRPSDPAAEYRAHPGTAHPRRSALLLAAGVSPRPLIGCCGAGGGTLVLWYGRPLNRRRGPAAAVGAWRRLRVAWDAVQPPRTAALAGLP